MDYRDYINKHAVEIEIRDARKWRGITQKQLAEMTGTRQSSIARAENGFNCGWSFISKMARAMGMKLKLEFIPEEIAYLSISFASLASNNYLSYD